MPGARTLLGRLQTLESWRTVAGHGRDVLEKRVGALCDWVFRLEEENIQLEDNLTATQRRCTELVEENRRLKAELTDPTRTVLGELPAVGLNGPTGPHFDEAAIGRIYRGDTPADG